MKVTEDIKDNLSLKNIHLIHLTHLTKKCNKILRTRRKGSINLRIHQYLIIHHNVI